MQWDTRAGLTPDHQNVCQYYTCLPPPPSCSLSSPFPSLVFSLILSSSVAEQEVQQAKSPISNSRCCNCIMSPVASWEVKLWTGSLTVMLITFTAVCGCL